MDMVILGNGSSHCDEHARVHNLGQRSLHTPNPHAIHRAHHTAASLINAFAQSDQLFFLDVGFQETHRAPGREVTHFAAMEDVQVDQQVCKPMSQTMPKHPQAHGDWLDFCRSAQSLDQRIGHVLDALDQAGLAENTIVLYTTDHGPAMPRCKATLSDMGIGVATIIRGPKSTGMIGGRICDLLLGQLDWFPTLCDLLSIERPVWLEGRSFAPWLQGDETFVGCDAVFAQQTYHAVYEPLRAIRTDRYKYIQADHDYAKMIAANVDDSPTKQVMLAAGWYQKPQKKQRFFDLEIDPLELDNRRDDPAYASVITDLQRQLHVWQVQTNESILNGPVALLEGVPPVQPDALSPWDGR